MTEGLLVDKRKEELRARIEQMRRKREWASFQRFCVDLLSHIRIRQSAFEHDLGKDGVSMPPPGTPFFVSVSFECSFDKIRGDVKRWKEDPNREPAEVVFFVTWGDPRETTLSKWRKAIREESHLDLIVLGQPTILGTATQEELWSWTCDVLGIPPDKGLNPHKAAELRGKYCEWLIGNHRKIDFAGYLPGAQTSGKPLFLPLEDVFVPLKLRDTFEGPVSSPETEKAWPDTPEAQPATEPPEPDVAELYEREGKREESRVLEVAEALANDPKAVILGDPGAGKSTLLKFITLAYARGGREVKKHLGLSETRTPILVSVAGLSKDDGNLVKHVRRQIEAAALDSLTVEVLRSDIESGGAIILLDGLDELFTMSDRLQMVRQIQSFVAAHPKNGYVVSSRIIGYNDAPVGPDFNELTAEPFDDPAIETFSRKWSIALEKLARGESPEAVQKGEQAGKDLHEAIMRNPGVKSLARNPLMLTILSLIHRQGKKMPSRRVELYAQCTKTLIESWSQARDISGIPAGEALDERDILDVLCPVAFRMHCDYPSGLIPGKELREIIIQAMVDVRDKDKKIAEREAESLLDVMKRQSGLIAERGQDAYGFLHLTFQEYLAAKYIALDREKIWEERLRPVLHHPRWREVVLLTAGCLGILMEDRQRCEDLVEEIRTAGSPLEDVLHRDLFLAVECICDDLKISPAAQLDVVKPALALWRTTKSKLFSERLLDLLARLPHGSGRTRAEQFFLNALKDKDDDVRSAAAHALGKLGQANPEIMPALLDALKDRDPSVRRPAAGALGSLAQASPEVVSGLLNALKDSDWNARYAAAEALGKLGQASPEVVKALLRALKEKEPALRLAAPLALGELVQASPEVVNALLKPLKDKDARVRCGAASALGNFGQASPEAMNALLRALEDERAQVRYAAAETLGILAQARPEIVAALSKALRDSDEDVRCAAAEALVDPGQSGAEGVNALLNALEDNEGYVRCSAAEALENLGGSSPEVVKALLNALKDNDTNVRCAAAYALRAAHRPSPEILNSLLKALKDPEEEVRYASAFVLGELGPAGPEVVNALLEALKDEGAFVRFGAAQALWTLSEASPEVVNALLNALKDKDGRVRSAAAHALGNLGPQASPEVVNALLNALKHKEEYVRSAAASALGNLGTTDARVTSALSRVFKENKDYDVANAAYGALLRAAAKLDRQKSGEPAPCE